MEQIKLEKAEIKTYGKISYIPQLEQIKIDNVEDKSILGKLNIHNIIGDELSGGEETKFIVWPERPFDLSNILLIVCPL